MRVTVEKISNGLKKDVSKDRSITDKANELSSEILSELKEKGEAIKSLTRSGGNNRKGTIVVYLPESTRHEIRNLFDLSREPEEFIIQCKSGKDTDNNTVILVTVGFTDGSRIIDSIEDWLIEEPMDGTEARTVATSRKVDYSLKQLAEVFKDIRGRQK